MPEPQAAHETVPERQQILESIKALAEQINALLQREVDAVKSQDTDELIRIGADLDRALEFQESLRKRLKAHIEEHACK